MYEGFNRCVKYDIDAWIIFDFLTIFSEMFLKGSHQFKQILTRI